MTDQFKKRARLSSPLFAREGYGSEGDEEFEEPESDDADRGKGFSFNRAYDSISSSILDSVLQITFGIYSLWYNIILTLAAYFHPSHITMIFQFFVNFYYKIVIVVVFIFKTIFS